MTDDQTTQDAGAGSATAGDALDYARVLLAAEDERASALRKQVPFQVGLAWAWFAFVQIGLLVIVAATRGDGSSDESGDWSASTIAIIVAVFAAAVMVALTTAAARFWAIEDVPSAYEAMPVGGAYDREPASGTEILKFTSQRLHDRRIANARRVGRLGAVRSAWVASMVFTLAELVAVVATLAQGA